MHGGGGGMAACGCTLLFGCWMWARAAALACAVRRCRARSAQRCNVNDTEPTQRGGLFTEGRSRKRTAARPTWRSACCKPAFVIVTMLNMAVASPRRRHWRDAASATRQAKSGDGGHDLSECQASELRWAAVSHQERCCPRFEPVRARARHECVHASPPASGYIHWLCPKHARPSRC